MDWLHNFHRPLYWRDTNNADAQVDGTGPSESRKIQFRFQGVNTTRVLAACLLEQRKI
jgi:hypothetical protein